MTTEARVPETMAERAEIARDLQLKAREALGAGSHRREWTIEDASPLREIWVLYSMRTGQRLEVPQFIGDNMVNKIDPRTGRPMFTAFREQAPQFRPGKVLCFLHPDSPESEVLREIGIYTECDANGLRNDHAKRVHAQKLHRSEWAAYQEYVNKLEQTEWREEQRAQTAAMIELAQNGQRRGRQSGGE